MNNEIDKDEALNMLSFKPKTSTDEELAAFGTEQAARAAKDKSNVARTQATSAARQAGGSKLFSALQGAQAANTASQEGFTEEANTARGMKLSKEQAENEMAFNKAATEYQAANERAAAEKQRLHEAAEAEKQRELERTQAEAQRAHEMALAEAQRQAEREAAKAQREHETALEEQREKFEAAENKLNRDENAAQRKQDKEMSLIQTIVSAFASFW